ncbi:unnamed protein product [Adineta steineri]|uniref:ADP-ribosylglycohydrolase n=1 Tax=Adineta steineri TaxID=433720 RepID=A0A814QL56_9BILA|nr:unnamed protein product [Adineta steineri]CAF1037492.1 unnamed protein product [Adineta steineri]CAF1120503.1 unnamed protein product [Adineta steineri]CAF3492772.1 unnamed protein product [Adineta steineri]CAF3541477.1 unnamed protein product [Adineta steineri]
MIKFPFPHEKKLPHDISISRPPVNSENSLIVDRISGSLIGLAIGDALGACVEFRSNEYLNLNPVEDFMSGGMWELTAGQWTDDTSMALCLASSLLTNHGFNPYDQMVRYKWWYKYGYLSSTGKSFGIGNATRQALEEFQKRQNQLKKKLNVKHEREIDTLSQDYIEQINFDVNCSERDAFGNGALMRIAPIPLFFYREPSLAIELAGRSARLTHDNDLNVDACRYFSALIVGAISGLSKDNLLSKRFYDIHRHWFGTKALHNDIINILSGSFKRSNGYKDGIRGHGHVVASLEAALWAFWKGKSFKEGVLLAVNLGDDTDTTAAIYGQLAGAYYTYQNIPRQWTQQLYANSLIMSISQWLHFSGYRQIEQPKQKDKDKDKHIIIPIIIPTQKPIYIQRTLVN